MFSIALNDVGKHAPLVDKATHPFSQSTSVDSLATDTVRREFGEAMALESGPLDEMLSLWATFCDDVADRLNNDMPLAEALDDTWVFGNGHDADPDVDMDDDPAAAARCSISPTAPNPGYYQARGTVFYVTSNAAVFVLRTGDEPVCLHRIDWLPMEAALTTARPGPRLALVARTAEELCKPTGPLSFARVEIRRDRGVALGAYLQAILTCALEDIGSVLVEEASPDPEGFHDRVTERLREVGEQTRRLNDERSQRRGERENAPPAPPQAGAKLAGSFAGKSAAAVNMRAWNPLDPRG